MQFATYASTTRSLTTLFVIHGIPEKMVSDNGLQFTSKEFKDLCNATDIRHTFSTPYHPSTSGEAERFVLTTEYNMVVVRLQGMKTGHRLQRFHQPK